MPASGMLAEDVFEYEVDQVLPFMQRLVPGLARSEFMTTIGLKRRGELIAAVAYEGFNGRNIWIHVAGLAGRLWATPMWGRAVFGYPFLVCGVERISGYVNASNTASRRFARRLGFRVESTLEGAAADGGDVLIYRMWRRECRFIRKD